jgi:hypothetical protein
MRGETGPGRKRSRQKPPRHDSGGIALANRRRFVAHSIQSDPAMVDAAVKKSVVVYAMKEYRSKVLHLLLIEERIENTV